MYLPTFWKLTAEAGFYRLWHIGGYVVPVGTLGKTIQLLTNAHFIQSLPSCHLIQFSYRCVDHLSITLQLLLLMY